MGSFRELSRAFAQKKGANGTALEACELGTEVLEGPAPRGGQGRPWPSPCPLVAPRWPVSGWARSGARPGGAKAAEGPAVTQKTPPW